MLKKVYLYSKERFDFFMTYLHPQTDSPFSMCSFFSVVSRCLFSLFFAASLQPGAPAFAGSNTGITADTPEPPRFFAQDTAIVDRKNNVPVFFKGIGYSPYMTNETPLQGAAPGNDERYSEHLALIEGMGANYIHLFPRMMPEKFFAALDKTDLVYGQDVWIFAHGDDFLSEAYQDWSINNIKEVIDHNYAMGRPDRLVLFSIGDELQPDAIKRTDNLHPEVHEYRGKHIQVTGRTPTEVALARLIDVAMDYELTKYGQRHLYCHTSFTHIGPVTTRPDLEVPPESVITPDLGDLICLNVYTYANGVRTSGPGSITGSTYQGYLEELATQSAKPIFITQVGLSTSPFEPKPWVPGFGGHSVESVPGDFKAIWRDLTTARGREKFTGIAFFEFQDEWWKSGEEADDSSRHERQDPEEWFGLYEVGPDGKVSAKGDIPAAIREIYSSGDEEQYTPKTGTKKKQ